MPQMNTGQARIIDPILTTHAQGFSNLEMIGHILFPRVIIPVRGAQVLKFGKEAFRKYNSRRAPGSNTNRVQYGYTAGPIAVVQESLEAIVPIEIMDEAAAVPNVNMAEGSVDMVMDVLLLNLETETSALALNADNYDVNHKMALAGADQWSNPSSDPFKDINAGREAIRRSIGRYPNTLALGVNVFDILVEHPLVKDKFKYVSSDSITEIMLAKLFKFDEVVVGKAIILPDDASEDDLADDVWANGALMAYVPPAGKNYRVPSFGYTYELPGMPMVEEPYYDNRAKSWIYPTTYERVPHLTGASAGFLIQTPVSNA